MEIIPAKNETIIVLRIEEDLKIIEDALELYIIYQGNEELRLYARSIRQAISNCNPRKDIQLRFS